MSMYGHSGRLMEIWGNGDHWNGKEVKVPEVDLTTVVGLVAAIGNHGGMQGKLQFYDEKTGKRYEPSAVYPSDDDDDVTCVDIKEIDFYA